MVADLSTDRGHHRGEEDPDSQSLDDQIVETQTGDEETSKEIECGD